MKTANIVIITLICYLSGFGICFSQEEEKESVENLVYRSTMFGIGGTSVYDSYLSAEKYTGTAVGLREERMSMTGIMSGNVSSQQIFKLDFSWSKNRADNATDYTGFVNYSYGLHYRFRPASNFQLFAGSQANGMLGFIYNTRNGNNPATAKAHVNLTLSGIAAYEFKIKSQPFKLRYQVDAPFAGVMFSQDYGQSYYEISLGNDDKLVHFASFHNQRILNNSLSLEIPFNSSTLRLTYINSLYETNVNELDTRINSNSFFIGFSKEFFSISGKKKVKGNYKRVFD